MTVYKVRELAKMLKVHPNTIFNWIYKGELKTLRVGRDYRITEEQLNQFLNKKNKE